MKLLLNILPPVATIVLSLIFCFANPYNSMPLDEVTIVIVFVLLIIPGLFVLVSYFVKTEN
ncbi:hypothetical protein [Cohnella abietis]|uniref:Uncharacterized protein n=1 Tax=Cohnella abietis TaxID=2507935 RepID=A0A3T1DCW0_9BACL|nr:hypothetical protein [Cohnella abietis]BBI35864.1 hypothetical protein KCTCHS21_52630 [Cohnella abietis]